MNLAAEAAALVSAIGTNVPAVTASSAAGVVTVTAVANGAAGNGIGTTETFASGFAWGGTSLTGGDDAKPSIVAYNNLYSTQAAALQGFCAGSSGPSVLWSYSTGTGAVVTSSVLSLDGKKLMYVETKAGGAVLHVLQWKSTAEGTLAAPVTPTTVTNWGSCAAGSSCVVNVAFNGSQQATNSAPFYDYTGDALYVGDNNGVLHKFTPVLTGTPAEVIGSGWPLTVHSGFILSSPVLDPSSNRIFVGDSGGRMSYIANPVSGTATIGGAVNLTGSIVDAPIVDSSAGKVFVFNGTDTTNNGSVYQFSTSLGSQITVDIGGGASGTDIHAGAFDNKYLTSGTGGFLFVCGKNITSTNHAAIHRIAINAAGTMTGGSSGGNLELANSSTGAGECSPVSEFYNTTTGLDWIFFSVGANAQTDAAGAACGTTNGGCLMSVNVTGTAWPPTAVTAAYQTPEVAGGASTSGIIIDNVGGATTVPSTALSAAITNAATSFTVASTTGFAANDHIQIDSEIIKITTVTNATTLAVTRAQLSTVAASHLINTAVTDLRVSLLNGAITNVATTIVVDSNTTFNVNDYIRIDNEVMKITARPLATTLTVTRAQLGSTNVTHVDNSTVSDLSAYPQAASIYSSFIGPSGTGFLCNGASGVGCAVKLTQSGLQ